MSDEQAKPAAGDAPAPTGAAPPPSSPETAPATTRPAAASPVSPEPALVAAAAHAGGPKTDGAKPDEVKTDDEAEDRAHAGDGSRAARWERELRARGRYTELAALLAFLVPGLGHLYLGRPVKGLLAFLTLVGLFGWGIGISRGECVSLAADEESGHRYAFVAQVGAGLPTALALLHTHSYEVKTALGMSATKPEEARNHFEDPEYVERLPKLDEGLLYTMVAGLLNLLLIYDAILGSPGAALRPRPEDQLQEVVPEPEPASGAPPPTPPERSSERPPPSAPTGASSSAPGGV